MLKHLLNAFAGMILCVLASSCASTEYLTDSIGQSTFELTEKEASERAFYSQPNAYFEARLESEPTTIDGQTLHPKLQYELQERRKERAARSDLKGKDYNAWLFQAFSTPEGRTHMRDLVDRNWTKNAFYDAPMRKTQEIEIPSEGGSIRARIYWPDAIPANATSAPALMYFHGGAYTIASIEAIEPQAKILANRAEVVVISVDYRLAPEHIFPAAQIDAVNAYKWFVANAETYGVAGDRIAVGGDSAGANLTLVVTQEMIDQNGQVPAANLLYYPFLDGDYKSFPSYEMFGVGYGLDKEFMASVTKLFTPDPEMLKHRWLNNDEYGRLEDMPPTIVATAGFDPIRDQGLVYADLLRSHGVNVVQHHYPSLTHGYLESSAVIDDAQKAAFETAEALRRLLH